jgi:hypothetical protein
MSPARRQHYSIVRHLAWSIWLNHDPRRCLVAVIAADFLATYDASGSENDRDGTLVVVGLVATEHKWNRFELEWQTVLDRFDVPYLHMKELNHRHSGEGVYAKWKDDTETPKLFLRALVKVLKRGINKAFCYATVLPDYKEINQEFRLREGVGSPYVLTAGSCYDLANAWMRKKYPKHSILHVFEQGDCGQQDFKRLVKRHNKLIIQLPKLHPETGEILKPFQGADLFAGVYRNAANKRGKVRRFEDYGEVFTDLAKMLPQRVLIFHKEVLRARCEANPDQCPKRG